MVLLFVSQNVYAHFRLRKGEEQYNHTNEWVSECVCLFNYLHRPIYWSTASPNTQNLLHTNEKKKKKKKREEEIKVKAIVFHLLYAIKFICFFGLFLAMIFLPFSFVFCWVPQRSTNMRHNFFPVYSSHTHLIYLHKNIVISFRMMTRPCMIAQRVKVKSTHHHTALWLCMWNQCENRNIFYIVCLIICSIWNEAEQRPRREADGKRVGRDGIM